MALGASEVGDSPQGAAIRVGSLTLLVIGGTAVVLRLFTRLFVLRRPATDDFIVFLALLTSIAMTVLAFQMANSGAGKHTWELTASLVSNTQQTFWALIITYNLSIVLTKLALILSFRSQLPPLWTKSEEINQSFALPYRLHRRAHMTIAVFTSLVACFGIATTVDTVFICLPIQLYWTDTAGPGNCASSAGIWYSNTAVDLALNIGLTVLAMPMLKHVIFSRFDRWAMTIVILLGFFITAASVVRLYYVSRFTSNDDKSYTMPPYVLWTLIETNASLLLVSLPALSPLINLIVPWTSFPFAHNYAHRDIDGNPMHPTDTGDLSKPGTADGVMDATEKTDHAAFAADTYQSEGLDSKHAKVLGLQGPKTVYPPASYPSRVGRRGSSTTEGLMSFFGGRKNGDRNSAASADLDLENAITRTVEITTTEQEANSDDRVPQTRIPGADPGGSTKWEIDRSAAGTKPRTSSASSSSSSGSSAGNSSRSRTRSIQGRRSKRDPNDDDRGSSGAAIGSGPGSGTAFLALASKETGSTSKKSDGASTQQRPPQRNSNSASELDLNENQRRPSNALKQFKSASWSRSRLPFLSNNTVRADHAPGQTNINSESHNRTVEKDEVINSTVRHQASRANLKKPTFLNTPSPPQVSSRSSIDNIPAPIPTESNMRELPFHPGDSAGSTPFYEKEFAPMPGIRNGNGAQARTDERSSRPVSSQSGPPLGRVQSGLLANSPTDEVTNTFDEFTLGNGVTAGEDEILRALAGATRMESRPPPSAATPEPQSLRGRECCASSQSA